MELTEKENDHIDRILELVIAELKRQTCAIVNANNKSIFPLETYSSLEFKLLVLGMEIGKDAAKDAWDLDTPPNSIEDKYKGITLVTLIGTNESLRKKLRK